MYKRKEMCTVRYSLQIRQVSSEYESNWEYDVVLCSYSKNNKRSRSRFWHHNEAVSRAGMGTTYKESRIICNDSSRESWFFFRYENVRLYANNNVLSAKISFNTLSRRWSLQTAFGHSSTSQNMFHMSPNIHGKIHPHDAHKAPCIWFRPIIISKLYIWKMEFILFSRLWRLWIEPLRRTILPSPNNRLLIHAFSVSLLEARSARSKDSQRRSINIVRR